MFLDLSLDGRVLAFTASVAVLTGTLFGVLPALRSTKVSLSAAMKGQQAEESERRVRFRPGKCIVAFQVALSLVLLVTAGLFLRSFVKLVTLDIGFDRNNVLVVNANLKTAKVSAGAASRRLPGHREPFACSFRSRRGGAVGYDAHQRL